MNARVVEVVVRGRLGPELVLALDGFAVETDQSGQTRIVGRVTDQARLFGLLEMFDDLNIEVVSVNPVDGAFSPERGEVGPEASP
jgi:hypothetical protein